MPPYFELKLELYSFLMTESNISTHAKLAKSISKAVGKTWSRALRDQDNQVGDSFFKTGWGRVGLRGLYIFCPIGPGFGRGGGSPRVWTVLPGSGALPGFGAVFSGSGAVLPGFGAITKCTLVVPLYFLGYISFRRKIVKKGFTTSR